MNKEQDVIANLMQFYFYDFSEYTDADVEERGRFGEYPYLNLYWDEPFTRFPYVIKQGGVYAGFVLVRYVELEETSHR